MTDRKRPEDRPELVKCPGCDSQLPADDLRGQVAHMDANHPDIIEQRRAQVKDW